jgi:hypothetical protein
MEKKIIVTYLCTPYVAEYSFDNFLKNYLHYKSGIKHKLLICYKNFQINQLDYFKNKLKKIDHIEFIDTETNNDFDLGSYIRISKKFKNTPIFFMNSHSYPVKNNWLKIIAKHYKKGTIIATSSSYSSFSSNSFYRDSDYNYFQYFYYIIKKLIFFPLFPNPHFCTTGFLINSDDYLDYNQDKKYNNKFKTHLAESGRWSIYRYFKKKKFSIFIVNSDNKKFLERDWPYSETFCFKEQSKSLISDNQSRNYLKLNKKNKKKKQFTVWGIN